jgi:hypothetical protein
MAMEVFFYVADDIQSLAANKTLMVGVYTDRVIVLNSSKDAPVKPSVDTPIGLPSLAVMLSITGLVPEERTVAPVLKFPDGSPSLNTIAPMKFATSPTGSANLLFKFTPFIVTLPGKYTLSLTIDGQPVDASFELMFNEL